MNRLKRFICVAALVIACCVTLVLPAFAAETAAVAAVPVTVTLAGSKPKPAEEFTIRLQTEDGSPLPAGADGEYTMQITGADTQNLNIPFERVGIYNYTISQDKGTHKRCKYDQRVYDLTVYVTNKEDYSGLETTIVLSVTDKNETKKVEDVIFRNVYPSPSGSAKTGDESQPLLYAGLTTLGVVMLAGLFLTRKPKTNEEE